MKRICTFALAALVGLSFGAVARRPTPHEALLVATSLLDVPSAGAYHPMSVEGQHGSVLPLYDRDGEMLLGYVYELEPTGYAVVSADTGIAPVVAYSLESRFCWDSTSTNVLLDMLQTDLSLRMKALREGHLPLEMRARNEASWAVMSTSRTQDETGGADTVVGPLLEAPTWAQTAPWNEWCPVDPTTGSRSATGCAATALAQIISYYQHPSSVVFQSSDSYVTLARQISVDATGASLDEINYGPKAYRNPSDDAMARLSLAAGVSLEMDYTSAGSGAYAIDIAVALAGGDVPMTSSRSVRPGVWQYESADIRSCVNTHWGAPFYQTATAFYAQLRKDIDESRPAVLCVTASNTSTGHILICDGYETASDRYHLNFGWGGGLDGWYAFPDDMPAEYNIIEYAILNIQPTANQGIIDDPSRARDTSLRQSKSGTGQFLASPSPFASEVAIHYAGNMVGVSISIAVYDLSGQLIWSGEESSGAEIRWDGRERDGEYVANGAYAYYATATDGASTVMAKGILFIRR
ncbi:C10 family peptidase [Candidatus Bipolaricaulota bacterium]